MGASQPITMTNVRSLDAARNLSTRAKGHGLDNNHEPPDNGDMELKERVIRMEESLKGVDTRLGLVEKDLRELVKKIDGNFLWLLAAMAGLAGLLAKGFKWI